MLDFNKAKFISRILFSGFPLGGHSFQGPKALRSLVNLKDKVRFSPLPCCPLLTKAWGPVPGAAPPEENASWR